MSQFRESGITPQDLALAAEKQSGSLAMKLFDISRLYDFYMDELEKAGMQDTLSAMARSVDQVKENGYFRGMTVLLTLSTISLLMNLKCLTLVSHSARV